MSIIDSDDEESVQKFQKQIMNSVDYDQKEYDEKLQRAMTKVDRLKEVEKSLTVKKKDDE